MPRNLSLRPPETTLLILGIETSTPRAGVALSRDSRLVASATLGLGRGHAEFTAPAISFLLEQAQIALSDLDAIAVGTGPGLFTGMRVGIITGELIATALEIPIVGVSSLDLIARQAGIAPDPIIAVVDARRREVFWAWYEAGESGPERSGEMRRSSPRECVRAAGELDRSPIFAGNGVLEYRDEFMAGGASRFAPEATAFPLAETLTVEAAAILEQGRLAPAEPVYMRGPDAEINWNQSKRIGVATEVRS